MTGRDRIVIMVIVVAVLLGGVWMEVVSPERKQVSQLEGQVASARAELSSAEGKVANAKSAQSQYAAAYAATVNLGKAVPPNQEVAALIDQLTQASNKKQVYFSSISSSASSASTSTSATPSVEAAGLTQLPFTFTFEGSYFDLEHLFNQLAGFTKLNASGEIEVSGRLLTIRGVSLTPSATSSSTTGSSPVSNLTGSITASAYVLPAGQGLTGSATPASPTGGASAASSTPSASSPVSPAIVKVNP
jgi:Tfp pilus assembly protein PilO